MSAEHRIQPLPSVGADLERSRIWSADLEECDMRRLLGTIAAEPEVAADLQDLLVELPVRNRRRLVRHFVRRLASSQHSRGAVLPALADLLAELTREASERHLSTISRER
jgi:hypothetical protein